MRCLETNVFSIATASLADLSFQARSTVVFDFLLRSIKPRLIIAHGRDAINHLDSDALDAEVMSVSHMSRGWSEVRARELGELLRTQVAI